MYLAWSWIVIFTSCANKRFNIFCLVNWFIASASQTEMYFTACPSFLRTILNPIKIGLLYCLPSYEMEHYKHRKGYWKLWNSTDPKPIYATRSKRLSELFGGRVVKRDMKPPSLFFHTKKLLLLRICGKRAMKCFRTLCKLASKWPVRA